MMHSSRIVLAKQRGAIVRCCLKSAYGPAGAGRRKEATAPFAAAVGVASDVAAVSAAVAGVDPSATADSSFETSVRGGGAAAWQQLTPAAVEHANFDSRRPVASA